MMWWHDGSGGSATASVETVAIRGLLTGMALGAAWGLLHHRRVPVSAGSGAPSRTGCGRPSAVRSASR
jgi:hypothetical protein